VTGLQVTTPTDTSIVMVRSFAAPATLVFDCLTVPELLHQWHGADGWDLDVCEVDLRPGGAWRFEAAGPGGARMGHGGVYQEVEAPRLLTYTERFDDQWFPGEALVTAVLDEEAGATARTTLTTTLTFATRAVRDAVLASPMERGLTESYRGLDSLLARSLLARTKEQPMNWTLEVVVVPVSDVEASKAFYADRLGFAVDHDTTVSDDVRIVQLTPPGSGCSVVISKGLTDMEPGSLKGLQLVVNDVVEADRQLTERGVKTGGVIVFTPTGQRPMQEGDDLNNVGFVYFDDPDANSWAVQQITSRP
jgi:uncharacterized protein YndB with AHSA1/START domain/catechol 2,3-dioxygenase-like lactoylglutathione lyase family enzyme